MTQEERARERARELVRKLCGGCTTSEIGLVSEALLEWEAAALEEAITAVRGVHEAAAGKSWGGVTEIVCAKCEDAIRDHGKESQ